MPMACAPRCAPRTRAASSICCSLARSSRRARQSASACWVRGYRRRLRTSTRSSVMPRQDTSSSIFDLPSRRLQGAGGSGCVRWPSGKASSPRNPTHCFAFTPGRCRPRTRCRSSLARALAASGNPRTLSLDPIVDALDLELTDATGFDVARDDQATILIERIIILSPAILCLGCDDQHRAAPADPALRRRIVPVGNRPIRARGVLIGSESAVGHLRADGDLHALLGNLQQLRCLQQLSECGVPLGRRHICGRQWVGLLDSGCQDARRERASPIPAQRRLTLTGSLRSGAARLRGESGCPAVSRTDRRHATPAAAPATAWSRCRILLGRRGLVLLEDLIGIVAEILIVAPVAAQVDAARGRGEQAIALAARKGGAQGQYESSQ